MESINHLNNFESNSKHKEYCFSSLPPKQFALISAILGVLISDELGVNEKMHWGTSL